MPNPYEGKSGRKPNADTQANYFKLRLLECIAGLDRGFAADGYAAMQVESATLALTEQSEPVMLSWTSGLGLDFAAVDQAACFLLTTSSGRVISTFSMCDLLVIVKGVGVKRQLEHYVQKCCTCRSWSEPQEYCKCGIQSLSLFAALCL